MKLQIGLEEMRLLTGSQEALAMLRNRVLVPEELLQDVFDWLDVNATDLWHYSECYFYFLGGLDHGNVTSLVAQAKQNLAKNS
jgi:hypothetical protein